MQFRTIGPVFIPRLMRSGYDPRSPHYDRVLRALPAEDAEVSVPNRREETGALDFADSREDDLDLRLLRWSPKPVSGAPQPVFHIYPNGVAIFEVLFDRAEARSAAALEEETQRIARETFDRHTKGLNDLLKRLSKLLPAEIALPIPADERVSSANVGWIARALLITDAERRDPALAGFIEEWLEGTARPEEARQIVSGEKDHSMTWLNYVVVVDEVDKVRDLFSATRTAQYFYAAQSALNVVTQNALEAAEGGRLIRKAEKDLIEARRQMQFLRILFGNQQGFLSRRRRRKFDDFMDCWDFDVLVANGDRIVEAATARLSEITAKRAERSSFVTDLILVAIAMVTVVEVSLYFTQYSREVMSRPVLGFTDSEASWVLTRVATIDADVMLLGGAATVFLLVLFYVYWKLRR